MLNFRGSLCAVGAVISLALLSPAGQAQIQPKHQAAVDHRDQDPESPRDPETTVPLTRMQFPDGSGSIRLPEGWKIVTAKMGAVHATGPNGEFINIGLVIPIYDSTAHRDRVLGRQRNLAPGIVCPYGEDVFADYACALKQDRSNAHLSAAILTLIRQRPASAQPNSFKAADAIVDLDLQDGAGLRTGLLRIAIAPRNPMGMYFLMLNALVTPKALAEQERPVLVAIAASYRLDTDWILRQVRESRVGEPNETGPPGPRVDRPEPDSAPVPAANAIKGVDH